MPVFTHRDLDHGISHEIWIMGFVHGKFSRECSEFYCQIPNSKPRRPIPNSVAGFKLRDNQNSVRDLFCATGFQIRCSILNTPSFTHPVVQIPMCKLALSYLHTHTYMHKKRQKKTS